MIYARDTEMNKTDFPHLGSACSYMTLKVQLHLAWSPHTGQALCWACSMDILSHSSSRMAMSMVWMRPWEPWADRWLPTAAQGGCSVCQLSRLCVLPTSPVLCWAEHYWGLHVSGTLRSRRLGLGAL